MISFFVCLAILIIGYCLYSKLIEKIFGPEFDRKTPALLHPEGAPIWPLMFIAVHVVLWSQKESLH